MRGDAGALTRLARLGAEIDVDRAALAARAAEIDTLRCALQSPQGLPRAELFLLAVNLHGYYTALEKLLERVARLLDEAVPAGPAWHVDLLSQMCVAVPSIRPAALPRAALDDLHELRKFRHFFRNAYVLDLDPSRVHAVADVVKRAHAPVAASLSALREHIDAAIAAITDGG